MHTLSMKSDTPRPHLAYFSTWILYHTLRVMVMYLLSGFELELYSVHEYHYIFWYLYEFLYGWLVSAITRADSFLMEQDIQNEAHKGRGSRKSAKNKRKKVAPRPYSLEILMYQAMQNICGGYYKVMLFIIYIFCYESTGFLKSFFRFYINFNFFCRLWWAFD